MSRATEIGNHALWLMGHLAFTVTVNLALFGAYHTYTWYQAQQPVQIDLTQLSTEDKQALASALIDDGFSIPKNIEDKPRKRG